MLNTCLVSLNVAARKAGVLDNLVIKVIDNGSEFPYELHDLSVDVGQIIRLDKGKSFAAASNLGARSAGEVDFLLFLNNDVFLHPMTIVEMFNAMRKTKSQIAGTRLVYLDGQIQHAGVLFDERTSIPRHVHHYRHTHHHPRTLRLWPAVTGAAMILESRVFYQLEGFDERYPFGFEDVDFCLRSGQAGYLITCSQATDSVHLSGRSHDQQTNRLLEMSKDIFLKKWIGKVPISKEQDFDESW
jgi:GT2 family glycosyltransferase